MTEQVCPRCGCSIKDGGYEKDGVTYCCQPCAEGGRCECGCNQPHSAHMPDSGFGGGGDAG